MKRSKEEKISVVNAMHMITSSLSAVSQSTIANSFKHCGFMRETASIASDSTSSMEEVATSVNNYDFGYLNPATTFAEFVEVDDNIATSSELLDETILPVANATVTSAKDDAAAAAHAAIPTSFGNMLWHIDGIRSYFCTRNATKDVLSDTAKLEGKLLRLGSKIVQQKLMDFFECVPRLATAVGNRARSASGLQRTQGFYQYIITSTCAVVLFSVFCVSFGF